MKSETIRAFEEKLKYAMLKSDVEVLNKIIDDDLVFTNHLGQSTTKQMDLEAHSSGFVKIASINHSEQKIKIFENIAIVTVLSQIEGVFGETHSTAKLHFTRVWQEKSNGMCQLIAAHSSTHLST